MSQQNDMLKIILAVVNHHDGVLELTAADLRAPDQGDGVLIEREPGKIILRRVSRSSEMHWLGKQAEPEVQTARSPSEEDNAPHLVTDEILARTEEAFRTRRRQ
ncbi:MAG TPA: hypothetical protein VGT24_01590 [Candidatus Acidoferrales bacterium]|nr:hypothetical protein [Candidatus Acidoferrales bacterium]